MRAESGVSPRRLLVPVGGAGAQRKFVSGNVIQGLCSRFKVSAVIVSSGSRKLSVFLKQFVF